MLHNGYNTISRDRNFNIIEKFYTVTFQDCIFDPISAHPAKTAHWILQGLLFSYEHLICSQMKNIVDPDQLASDEAS